MTKRMGRQAQTERLNAGLAANLGLSCSLGVDGRIEQQIIGR